MGVESILKTIDKIFEAIPPNVAKAVRLSSILVWLVLATIVIFYSVQAGQVAAPQTGEDLSMATLKERIQKERNLRSPGELTVPDLSELVTEESGPDFRARRDSADQEELQLNPESAKPFEPLDTTNEPGTMQADPDEVPYRSESLDPYPKRQYRPATDPGSAGERTRPESGNTELMPLPGSEKETMKQRSGETENRPVQTSPAGTSSQPAQDSMGLFPLD